MISLHFLTLLPPDLRNLQSDCESVPSASSKTAAQKNMQLERMLGLISQFPPLLLRNDIIKKSTSLNWIWQCKRKHSFRQSEVNFLKLSTIKREDVERCETLQGLIVHLEDNLVTVGSGLINDGSALSADEEMLPRTERLSAYL